MSTPPREPSPSTTSAAGTAAAAPVAPSTGGLIEHTGIEIIRDSERTARPRDLFWPWFAANVSVFSMSYGSWIFDFNISFIQATIVALIGIPVSFFLCGLIAIAGKRGSAPTMVLSRAAFGVHGQKVPGIVSWLTSIGWETFLAIMAVLATATVFSRLGLPSGTGVLVAAAAAVATLIVVASVLGYHTIMKLQSIFTWLTGAITIVYIVLTVPYISMDAVMAMPAGSWQAMIGALVMVMTGLGLGWINIAADWSRYQKRTASDAAIVAWNTFGGAVAPMVLVMFGMLIGASNPELRAGVAEDPIGALASILPIWVLIPFWLTAVLALVSGAVLGIYSSGLTLLSLGIRIPRPLAAGIDGLILTVGTVYVVFFAESFLGPFQSFLLTLGVPLAAWAGILIADILTRRADYDEAALFDARGRYGAFDWVSLATMGVASLVGWGLVVNQIESAPWNDWQGYLFEPLGLGSYVAEGGYWEGPWAYSNVGVLFALACGFLVTLVARRGTIRKQEEGLAVRGAR